MPINTGISVKTVMISSLMKIFFTIKTTTTSISKPSLRTHLNTSSMRESVLVRPELTFALTSVASKFSKLLSMCTLECAPHLWPFPLLDTPATGAVPVTDGLADHSDIPNSVGYIIYFIFKTLKN